MKQTVITALLLTALAASPAVASESAPAALPTPATPAPAVTPAASPAAPAAAETPSGAKPALLESKPQLLGPLAALAPVKLGYVNLAKISDESKISSKAKDTLTKTRDKYQKQLSAKAKKLETLKKSLEEKAPKMNQLERESSAKDFKAKVTEYQESAEKLEKEMNRQAEATRRKLQEQILKTVKDYGEKNGFTLIASELLYSDGNHTPADITDDVIRELDN